MAKGHPERCRHFGAGGVTVAQEEHTLDSMHCDPDTAEWSSSAMATSDSLPRVC
jgi:hypothetical protein